MTIMALTSLERAFRIKDLNRVACGTAILIKRKNTVDLRDELLMIQRTGSHGAGTWSVPGGWVDAGEDPLTTACREAWEEVHANLNRDDLKFLGYTFDQHPEGIEDVCLWFEVYIEEHYVRDDRPRWEEKIADVRWCPINALPTPLFPPLERAIEKGLLV